MRLTGARVLVTGATGGIGSAVARELAEHGARLVLHGRDEDELRSLDVAVEATVAADFADPGSAEKVADEVGPVDVLMHCAGIGCVARLDAMSDPSPEELIRVDLVAPIELTRAVLPGMLDRGRGHLAYLGSIAGLIGVPEESVYSAAKAGLITFADALRLELRGSGVAVSTLSPAAVDTAFWAQRRAPYARSVPRQLSPEYVARVFVRNVERWRQQRVLPRWLAIAPAVRALTPRGYQQLAARLG